MQWPLTDLPSSGKKIRSSSRIDSLMRLNNLYIMPLVAFVFSGCICEECMASLPDDESDHSLDDYPVKYTSRQELHMDLARFKLLFQKENSSDTNAMTSDEAPVHDPFVVRGLFRGSVVRKDESLSSSESYKSSSVLGKALSSASSSQTPPAISSTGAERGNLPHLHSLTSDETLVDNTLNTDDVVDTPDIFGRSVGSTGSIPIPIPVSPRMGDSRVSSLGSSRYGSMATSYINGPCIASSYRERTKSIEDYAALGRFSPASKTTPATTTTTVPDGTNPTADDHEDDDIFVFDC